MQRDATAKYFVKRAEVRAARLANMRAHLPPMPWHLRARRAITTWLFAWQAHEHQAVMAELERELSEVRARGLDKP